VHKQFQPVILPDQAISTEKAPGEGTAGQERGLDPAARHQSPQATVPWARSARCRLGFLA
jgi:hypothetical protein